MDSAFFDDATTADGVTPQGHMRSAGAASSDNRAGQISTDVSETVRHGGASPDCRPSTPAEMRFVMEARRFLQRGGTVERALDLLAVVDAPAEATKRTPRNSGRHTCARPAPPPDQIGSANKAISKPPGASGPAARRYTLRDAAVTTAGFVYRVDGDDVLTMSLGRVRTLARLRIEQAAVLAEIAARTSHLPHTMVVADLLSAAELERMVDHARRKAGAAI